jgi:hypothetical protein
MAIHHETLGGKMFTVSVYLDNANIVSKKFSFIKRVEYCSSPDRIELYKKDMATQVPDVVICPKSGAVIVEQDV